MNTKFVDRVFRVLFVFAFVLGFVGIPGQSANAQDLPHIIEVNIDDYYVTVGYNVWADNALLTMTANASGTIYSAQATSQENNGWWFDLPHTLNLQAGDTVTVTDGSITRTYTISPPQVTQIDLDADTVTGTAMPLSHLGVHTCTGVIGGDCAQRLVTADASGHWVADFHDPLAPAPPGSRYPNATADLVPGHRGQAIEYDDQGNATWVDWIAPNPEIEANITGQYIVTRESVFPPMQHKWPLGTELALTVDNPSNDTGIDYNGTAIVDQEYPSGWGRSIQTQADFAWPAMGLQPGFILTVTGNGTTKTLVVAPLKINTIDTEADTVAGTASPGATVDLCSNVYNCVMRHVTADSSGNWLANYHIPGTEPDEQETVNIQGDTNGWAAERDDDGDETMDFWYVPANQPPVAEAGGLYTVYASSNVTLDASASSDPDGDTLTYEWDLDNDGQYDDASGVTITTSFNQIGDHTIGLRVTDDGGLSDTDTATVTVLPWTLKGFYQPVDMNGIYNIAQNGSTVPFKFEIFAGPTELTDITYVTGFAYIPVACDSNASVDIIETTVTGGTSLRYDATTGQFVYNWKTPKTAGKCYRVTMTTIDGSSLVAYFKLK